MRFSRTLTRRHRPQAARSYRWGGAPVVKDARPRRERRPAPLARRKASRRAEQRKNRALAAALAKARGHAA